MPAAAARVRTYRSWQLLKHRSKLRELAGRDSPTASHLTPLGGSLGDLRSGCRVASSGLRRHSRARSASPACSSSRLFVPAMPVERGAYGSGFGLTSNSGAKVQPPAGCCHRVRGERRDGATRGVAPVWEDSRRLEAGRCRFPRGRLRRRLDRQCQVPERTQGTRCSRRFHRSQGV